MKYIFFDIECANGNIGTICSFGYVITDEKFNEIFSRDVLINPKSKFYLKGRAKRPDVELAYPKESFLESPKFHKRYPEIKSMLEGDDIAVIGYSVLNDVGFLVKDSMRYKLPGFNFKFFDVQKLFCKLIDTKKLISLSKASELLGIELSEHAHRSDEDARQTMRVLKEICKQKGMTFKDCIEQCPEACGEVTGLEYYQGDAHYIEGKRVKEFKDQNGNSYYIEQKLDRRMEKPGCENYILRDRRNYLMFRRFIDFVEPKEKNDKLAGKTICISLNYEHCHFAEMIKLIQLITNAGGKYITKASNADIFVENPEIVDDRCTRLEYVNKAISEGKNITVLSFEDFLNLLGTNKEEFDKMPNIDTTYLLDVKYGR